MLEVTNGSMDDLDAIAQLEQRCFEPEEAASRETLKNRLEVFPNHFWLLKRDGKLVGMVNGMAVNQDRLSDDLYEDTSLHQEDGRWQMLFGVCTDPDFRKKGYASLLMKEVLKNCEDDERKGILLNCREKYIPFYEKLGFVLQGPADSDHGGYKWYQMEHLLDNQE